MFLYFKFIFLVFIFATYSLAATSSGAFLRTPIGAKNIALGGAYGASIRGPLALVWNPAGISTGGHTKQIIANTRKFDLFNKEKKNEKDSTEDRNTISLDSILSENADLAKNFSIQVASTLSLLGNNRELLFSGISYSSSWGGIALAVLGNQNRKLRNYDQQGQYLGDFINYTYAGYIGYSIELGSIRIGTTVNAFQENLKNNPIYGGGIDVGAQWVSSIFSIGASVHNLGGIVQRSSLEKTKFTRLNTVARMSGSVLIPKSPINLYLGGSVNLDNRSDGFKVNIGFSVHLFKYTEIGFGLNHTALGGGLFFNFPYVNLGYSINKDLLSNNFQHHVDFTLTF